MILRALREGGWLRPRRIGCLLLVFLVLLFTVLWLLGAAVSGITAWFRNDPPPVAGSPFDPVTPTSPTSPPTSGPPPVDLINDGKLIVAVPEGHGLSGPPPGEGDYAGFDVALLGLVAEELGADSVSTDKRVSTETRVAMLTRRAKEADLALFALTPQQRQELGRQVDIVGPYLVSELRLVVPTGSAVTGLDSLGDGRVCAPRNSAAAAALADELGSRLTTRAGLGGCANLLGRTVGAIAADEIALRALPDVRSGEWRMVGAPLGVIEYSIGLPPGDEVLGERVRARLRAAIADDTWTDLYEKHIGAPAPPPPTVR